MKSTEGKKGMIKTREDMQEMDMKVPRIKEQRKNWFFERVNRNDKPLATLTKTKNEKTQIKN